jgi:hypothetical protein
MALRVLALFTVAAGCITPQDMGTGALPGSAGGTGGAAANGGSTAGRSGSAESANGGNQGGSGNQGGASGGGGPISGGGGTAGPPITDCPAGLHYCPLMGCVDSKSPTSCGLSCDACPTITGGGTPTCSGMICGGTCPGDMVLCKGACIAANAACMGTCPAGSHDCSGVCVSNMNVNSCGPTSCSQCQPPTDGAATCDGVKCDFTCGKLKRCVDKCYGCCANADCPVTEPGQLGVCDATSHTCTTMCAPGNKSCNGSCIPEASCCTNSDCKPPALQIGMCDPGTRQCVFTCTPGTTRDCGGGKCVPTSACCVDTDCGLCKKCSANVCVNEAAGEDLKSECAGLGCSNAAACNACTGTTTKCSGTMVQRCVNGQFGPATSCGDCMSCQGTSCLPFNSPPACPTLTSFSHCVNGQRVQANCAPRSCNGTDIVEDHCVGGVCGRVTVTPCGARRCATNSLVCNECVAGVDARCVNNLRQTCTASGAFNAGTSCGPCRECPAGSSSCRNLPDTTTCTSTQSFTGCRSGVSISMPQTCPTNPPFLMDHPRCVANSCQFCDIEECHGDVAIKCAASRLTADPSQNCTNTDFNGNRVVGGIPGGCHINIRTAACCGGTGQTCCPIAFNPFPCNGGAQCVNFFCAPL